VWLTDNQMNYYFGSIYLVDSLFWTLCMSVLYYDYNRLQKLSIISRFAWAAKFLDLCVQFALIYIGYANTQDVPYLPLFQELPSVPAVHATEQCDHYTFPQLPQPLHQEFRSRAGSSCSYLRGERAVRRQIVRYRHQARTHRAALQGDQALRRRGNGSV
jgi:hypothetical protein